MFILRNADDKNGGFDFSFSHLMDDDEEIDLDSIDVDDEDEEEEDDDLASASDGEYIKYKLDNKVARLDISASSKQDHRYMTRFTKKEAEESLRKDLITLRKPKIKPFAIVKDFEFKKKSSDKDIPDKNNVDVGNLLVIGRLPKWKTIMHQLNERPYILGECMFVQRGNYDIGPLKPHIALVLTKKYKTIKPTEVRDCFDPIKALMQNGKPVVFYKEFPKRLAGK